MTEKDVEVRGPYLLKDGRTVRVLSKHDGTAFVRFLPGELGYVTYESIQRRIGN